MVSICPKICKLVFGLLTHKDNSISKVSSQKGIFHFEEHPNQHHIPGLILICNRKNIGCRCQVYQSPIASDCCNRSVDLDWSSLSQYAPPVAKPQLPSGLTATKGPLPLPHPYLVLRALCTIKCPRIQNEYKYIFLRTLSLVTFPDNFI